MKTMAHSVLLLLASVMALGVVGCSSESAGNIVKGNVTVDGQPLEKGMIYFITVDRSAPSVEAPVTDGQFEVVVSEGEKRVEINAPKVTGQKKAYNTPESPMIDVVAELLPVRYNAQSELKYTVLSGDQEKSFELKSR